MRPVLRVPLVAAAAAALVLTQLPVAHAAPPPALVVGAERALTAARPGSSQANAAVAFANGVFFVVWEESAAGAPTQVYGARVKPDGTVLDRNGLLLSTRPEDSNVRPRVAGGGGKFLVVWQIDIEGTYSDLGAAMVTVGGKVQKQWGLSFGDNGQTSPDVAWNGQLFLAVWQDEPDPIDEDIYGARVTVAGLTLDGCSSDSCPNGDDVGIPIAVGTGNQVRPTVTGSPDVFLVAWQDQLDPASPTVRDTAVALNGSSLDTTGFALTSGAGAQSEAAVAWNGTTALFTWTNVAGPTSDIRGTTMKPGDEQNYTPTPMQPNGINISSAPGNQNDSAIARRSGHFVVAWADARSGNSDIFASRVGIAGAVFDPNGVGIATGARVQRAPAMASSGPKVLLAYDRDVPAAPFNGGERVFLRVIS